MVASSGVTGRLSTNFVADEFRCPHCRAAVVDPQLVVVLERIRSRIGRALPIVSGYRCPIHNAAAGGASNSQHMYGTAADIPPFVSAPIAMQCGARGVGTRAGLAVHVDVRRGAVASWVYS